MAKEYMAGHAKHYHFVNAIRDHNYIGLNKKSLPNMESYGEVNWINRKWRRGRCNVFVAKISPKTCKISAKIMFH